MHCFPPLVTPCSSREKHWDLDIVCPVPDGSRPAAIQIAAELGLPYREGLVKNRYVSCTALLHAIHDLALGGTSQVFQSVTEQGCFVDVEVLYDEIVFAADFAAENARSVIVDKASTLYATQ